MFIPSITAKKIILIEVFEKKFKKVLNTYSIANKTSLLGWA
jgi:hypothetical protein